MKKILKIGLFGFLMWLIPFVVSFFFYSPEGTPLIDKIFFKTIMIIVASITGAVLLIIYFKKIKKDYLKEGIIVGFAWLLINWILDVGILIPLAKMSIVTYFAEIGLRYLIIPTMSIAIGYAIRVREIKI
ncbi:MAG: hypothetical protein ACE5WD_07480 [Candidatus Aminicenantia bacterium]